MPKLAVFLLAGIGRNNAGTTLTPAYVFNRVLPWCDQMAP